MGKVITSRVSGLSMRQCAYISFGIDSEIMSFCAARAFPTHHVAKERRITDLPAKRKTSNASFNFFEAKV